MSAHTRNAWRLETDATGHKALAIRCEPDEQDAGTYITEIVSSRGIGETLANAKLMTKAPALYEAVYWINEFCRDHPEWEAENFPEGCAEAGWLSFVREILAETV